MKEQLELIPLDDLKEALDRKPKAADYDTFALSTSPVCMIEIVKNWKTSGFARGSFPWALYGDNRDAMRKLFGKVSFCYRGSHYYNCYLFVFEEAQLLVLTAKDHGTSIEVVTSRYGEEVSCSGEMVLRFLETLADLFYSHRKAEK